METMQIKCKVLRTRRNNTDDKYYPLIITNYIVFFISLHVLLVSLPLRTPISGLSSLQIRNVVQQNCVTMQIVTYTVVGKDGYGLKRSQCMQDAKINFKRNSSYSAVVYDWFSVQQITRYKFVSVSVYAALSIVFFVKLMQMSGCIGRLSYSVSTQRRVQKFQIKDLRRISTYFSLYTFQSCPESLLAIVILISSYKNQCVYFY